MSRVLLGVTGSVAAIHTKLLFDELTRAGHEVKIVATKASLYFFSPIEIANVAGRRDPSIVILDEDEWPGAETGQRYQRTDTVLHIELRRWADILLIAPLDANTLAKLALGQCDNCLTCVYRAWDRSRRVVLAPAMNTSMWDHPATARHLWQIAEDMGGAPTSHRADPIVWINENVKTLRIVEPQSKRLACDDVGIGALAERSAILQALT